MQSNGGLAEAHGFQGKDAILSGPAGGIVGAARTAAMAGLDRIIGFDMGGTSTDVALYAGGFERAFETAVAGVRMRAPMMAINTVAAGGGSILHFDGARFRVGPGSAGADPGPACYRRGGPLTVTDANVCVGKIQPRAFPGDLRPGWRPAAGRRRRARRNSPRWPRRSRAPPASRARRAVAEGFLRIAVANMANAIKQVSVQKGHDATRFALQCFGGAGGQHACLVADALGMETVFIHPFAGVLSAYGMGLADQTVMREQAVEVPLDGGRDAGAGGAGGPAGARMRDAALAAQGADPGRIDVASAASALCRHRGGADRALRHARPRSSPISPRRTARGSASPHPSAPLVVEAVAVEATAPAMRCARHVPPRAPRRARTDRDGAHVDRRRCSTTRRCSTARRCSPATASPGRR